MMSICKDSKLSFLNFCVFTHMYKQFFFNKLFFPPNRHLNLLSTATPAVGSWLVPIDQVKSSLNKLETEATLRVCAVMGCIMTEALEVKIKVFLKKAWGGG